MCEKKEVRSIIINLPKVPNTRQRWLNNFLMAKAIEKIMKEEVGE